MIRSIRTLFSHFYNYRSRSNSGFSDEKLALIALLFACDQTQPQSAEQNEQRLTDILLHHQLLLGVSDPIALIQKARQRYHKVGNPYLVIDQVAPFIRASYRPLMLFYTMNLLWADGNITDHKDQVLEYVRKALAIPYEDSLDLMELALIQMPLNQTIIELATL